MPSLMSAHRSPNAKQVPSPSIYFHYPTPPRPGVEMEQQVCPPAPVMQNPHGPPQLDASRKQKIAEMRLFDQQFAILNDIMANNNNNQYQNQPLQQHQQPPVSQPPIQSSSFAPLEPPSQYPQHPQTLPINQNTQCPATQPSLNSNFAATPTNQPPSLPPSGIDPKKQSPPPKGKTVGYSPSAPPITSIEIRIPSPKRVNYVPNTTDVIISTPQVSSSSVNFDSFFFYASKKKN